MIMKFCEETTKCKERMKVSSPLTKIGLSSCLVILVIWCSSGVLQAEALSQQNIAPPSKPIVYVDIERWEDRSAYPRFIFYRDHFRRQLDPTKTKENSPIISYSKPEKPIISPATDPKGSSFRLGGSAPQAAKEDASEYDTEEDIASLEQLLAERNGIVPKSNKPESNAKIDSQQSQDDSADNATPRQDLTFPKDMTNPCNRLQVAPEEIHQESGEASQKNDTAPLKEHEREVEVDSLELGNRENFGSEGSSENTSKESGYSNDDEMSKLISDAVPTFDLTMNIIKLSGWSDENVVFSPLSIANVLSIIMGGESFDELAALLDRENSSTPTSQSIFRYHGAFQKLLGYLKHMSGEQVILSIASEVFVNKSFPIRDEFRRDALIYYDAPLETFDFAMDGRLFQNKANQWVKEKTKGQIQSILDEPPSPYTTLGIINAIYFKGPWEIPFSEKLTRWREFHVGPKEKTKAQMMVNIMSVLYVEREAYKMIALPYKNNRTGLYVILPKGEDGINDLKNVETILSKSELKESILAMNTTKVTVSLPKMKFSSDGRMEEILQKMQLSTVFTPGYANFSGISPEGLYISSLLHRAIVEINEKGTEASAVSLGTGDRIIEDLPLPFRCDKPFLFFIYHVRADTILFWGRVIRPSEDSSPSGT